MLNENFVIVGVLTLLYSVIRGFGAEDSKIQFVVVSIGLFISLVLGYIKFIKPRQNSQKRKK